MAIEGEEAFLSQAMAQHTRSDDPSTKVGCVIVRPDLTVLSAAANEFPRGVNRSIAGRYERPEKYQWIEHAERNAIYAAAHAGMSTKNCSMYVVGGMPCPECARAIVQSGIIRVVAQAAKSQTVRWHDLYDITRRILAEAGVSFVELWRD